MTRKDYIRIAAALKSAFPQVNPSATWQEATARVAQHAACCYMVANALAQEPGTRFDRAKFLTAAGVA